MLFSERYGHTNVRTVIQKNSIDNKLRTELWNLWHDSGLGEKHIIRYAGNILSIETWRDELIEAIYKAYWKNLFSRPADDFPDEPCSFYQQIKHEFFNSQYHWVYDFLEFTLMVLNTSKNPIHTLKFTKSFNEKNLNYLLEKGLSAYRVINNQIVEITSEAEIKATEDIFLATKNDKFQGVHNHLQLAFNSLYDRKLPDYKSAIRESINALEAIQKIVLNKEVTGGEGMRQLRNNLGQNKEAKVELDVYDMFYKIYGKYTELLRHGRTDVVEIGFDQAKLAYGLYVSIISYLISTINNK